MILANGRAAHKGAQYLEQSLAAYRAALEVRTREQLPQDWAWPQNNRGFFEHLDIERLEARIAQQFISSTTTAATSSTPFRR